MKTKDDLMCVGYVKRPNGYKGNISISLTKEVALIQGNFFFVHLDGQFVPYRVDEIKGNNVEPLCKLHFVDTFEQAKELIGAEVYIPTTEIPETNEYSLIGYKLKDKDGKKIGEIVDVLANPGHSLLLVLVSGKEVMIPLVEDFILGIKNKKKQLFMDFPKDLLEL